MQRCGQVVITMLAHVKQKTIEPFIKETIVPGTLVYTDEYSIYARLIGKYLSSLGKLDDIVSSLGKLDDIVSSLGKLDDIVAPEEGFEAHL